MSQIIHIQDHSHILGVYSSPQRKIEDGLEYLRIGFEEKNEAVLLITDELTKDEVINEIIKKWKISSSEELANLEKNCIINIKSSSKLYFSTNTIDRDNIFKQYSDITNKAIEKGKRGLRAFVDLRIFFERGYKKYVIEFEKSLPPSYDFPLTFICAYDLDDFEKLDHQSRKILFDHHILHLRDNLFQSIFDNPNDAILTEHICMHCEDNQRQTSSSSLFVPIIKNSIIQYLGEGLRQKQLCVYISMYNLKNGHQKNIISQISHLKVPQIENNLIIILNTDNYYINAACDNLKPFEDLKKLIFEKATLDNKKDIRIVCDIPNFLFKNKHFDQCIAVEEWWDQTLEDLNKRHGLNVSLLCLYNSNNFEKAPFKYHRYRINDKHSIVCDSEGRIHSKFDSYIKDNKK